MFLPQKNQTGNKTKQETKKIFFKCAEEKRQGRGCGAEQAAVSHADSCPTLPAKPLGKDDRKLVLRET